MEGDEHVAVLDSPCWHGRAPCASSRAPSPWSRRCAILILGLPFIADWDGRPIYSVEPSLPGQVWRIEEGPVQAIVFLDHNHGGHSVMTPLDREDAFRRSSARATCRKPAKPLPAARLRMLILGAGCYRLSLGDLDNAVWHLRRLGYPA